MRICYLTLTKSPPTRDLVYLNGLKKLGIQIVDCRDITSGLMKFWNLWKKHRALKNNYDILFVGYAGHILVPFAKIISRKKIVFNALGSYYDGVIESRKQYGFLGTHTMFAWIIDWLDYHCADITLVESNARKNYIIEKFGIPDNKLIRLWSGVDDSTFVFEPSIKRLSQYTILFRGALMPEAGIEYLLDVAKILEHEPIMFRIIGSGIQSPIVSAKIRELSLNNIEWISHHLPQEELTHKMQECHISLGQLSGHRRQNFHIPFKTFEAMVLKIPQLVARTKGVLELLTENTTCFCFKPGDARDIAEKILWLKSNPDELSRISQNAYELFCKEATTKKLSGDLYQLLHSLVSP